MNVRSSGSATTRHSCTPRGNALQICKINYFMHTKYYKGYFLNGETFDQSNANGATFPLNRVISGWTEGIPLFKEGGEGVLIIPSNLGYGPSGNSSIPGGAVLVFDIKLISVN